LSSENGVVTRRPAYLATPALAVTTSRGVTDREEGAVEERALEWRRQSGVPDAGGDDDVVGGERKRSLR
jgi:hypothetical protein